MKYEFVIEGYDPEEGDYVTVAEIIGDWIPHMKARQVAEDWAYQRFDKHHYKILSQTPIIELRK